jgi:hypothetical protein
MRRFTTVAIVAAFLLATACGTKEQTAPEYRIPQDRDVRGLASEEVFSDEELWAGISAYEAGDMGHALAYLRTTGARGVYGDVGNLYLASAQTLSGQYDRALSTLGRVETERLPQPWRDEARWILYVALYGAGEGEGEEAAQLLEELTDLEGEIGDLARAQSLRLSDR